MRRLIVVASLLFFCAGSLLAQTGEISGRVVDDKGEGLPFATVSAEQNGKLISGVQTDFDGYYSLKLDPGTYDIKASAINLNTKVIRGVTATSNKVVGLDITTSANVKELEVVEVKYKKPIVDKDETATMNTISAEEIAATPATDIGQIIATNAGIYQGDDGEGLHFRGGRADAYEVYIDGIRVIGTYNVPVSSIQELNTYTGGIPAKFGDATSGIIEIITKGPASEFGGTVDVSTSQGMDPYGFTRATADLTGPIVKVNKDKDNERVALGFYVSGEYIHEKDGDPSAFGVYTAKDDSLKLLEENPLAPSSTPNVFIPRTETVRMDDLENQKSKPNVATNSYSLSGKLEGKPTKTITLAAGGNYQYSNGHSWVDRYTLFNSVNNPYFKSSTWRVYGRFRQRFPGKASGADEDAGKARKVSIQNAYYQVQFDYTKVNNQTEDDTHGTNPFDYGYLGKFDILKQPLYTQGKDDATGKTGTKLVGFQDTLVRFQPSDINPTGTAFTNQYYDLVGASFENGWWTTPYGGAQDGLYENLSQIQSNAGRGTLNGDRQSLTHGIWYNTGRQYNGYSTFDNRQFSLSVLGAADIVPGKTGGSKHGLEFGFEFEQRVQSSYQIAPIELWSEMRQLANKHIDQLDTDNPWMVIDGDTFSYNDPEAPAFGQDDTIFYNRKYVADQQTYFDKSVRKKLGLAENSTDYINIDNYDPSFYSLDMFSADELLGSGQNSYVFYAGYDYLGNRLSSQPSFDDFFKAKDDNGNYTRPIGSYRPIYSSAFIQDKFNFKDLLFNVGLRIDRFDANQKVLRDPYTLYESYTVGEARDRIEGDVPDNIGDDFVVYVDDFKKPNPKPTGYRDGDTWYTSAGVETSNPKVIADGSGGQIKPYLKNPNDDIKSPDYEPSASFKDYEPAITVMPRIAFSFNITESANFFAHYEILTQRPQGFNQTSPDDWFFLVDRGNFINNPALKPEKTIDYEVGFKQALTQEMAVSVSAYYREFKDMVQTMNVAYAYPKDYLTFGNIDFGTVKGFSLGYELQKSATSPFSLDANYTIQFAQGTGSDATSQQNLVAANQPNLRTIGPLGYDSRHNINLVLDYSYGEGKDYIGPVVKNKQILSNAGINLIARAWSGTPYTQQQNPTPDAETGTASRRILTGSINGSRLPWSFKLDFKIWKEFKLNGNRESKDADGNVMKPKRTYRLNVYLLIRNLLNTENIMSVYPYTGNADDDGYLTSELGKQELGSKANADSYQDLYNVYIKHPNNYTVPRNIRVGAIFRF